MSRAIVTGKFDSREKLESFVVEEGEKGTLRRIIAEKAQCSVSIVTKIHVEHNIMYARSDGKIDPKRKANLGVDKTRGPYATREILVNKVKETLNRTGRISEAAKEHCISTVTVRDIVIEHGIMFKNGGTKAVGRFNNHFELELFICSSYKNCDLPGCLSKKAFILAVRAGVSVPTVMRILYVNKIIESKNKTFHKLERKDIVC